MPIKSKAYLYTRFETGDIPTQQDFRDLIDSLYGKLDDPVLGATGPAGVNGTSGTSGTSGVSGSVYLSTINSNINLSTITVGSTQTLTPLANKANYSVGQSLIVAYDSTHYYLGTVTSYTAGTDTLVLMVDSVVGTGSYNATWQINLSGHSNGSGGGGSVEFFDEGISVGTYAKVNFVGTGVFAAEKPGDNTTINVYVPPPTFVSHFNTNDGISSALVTESNISRYTVRISSPTSEGTPFSTNTWATSNREATLGSTPIFSTAGPATGFSAGATGDSSIDVIVYDADGVGILSQYTTPVLYQNGVYTDSLGITVTLTSYGSDSLRYKASVQVSVNTSTIFGTNARTGGRYHVKITHNTDTDTDGTGPYIYTQTDVFYDTNPNTPSFGGGASATIIESTTPSNIVTKHISGVEYYTTNSQFIAHTDTINNLNGNTQGRSYGANTNFNFVAPNYGLPAINQYAWSATQGTFTGWTNLYNNTGVSYDISNWAINAASFRYRGTGANASATVYDPWNTGGSKTSSNHSILVDTYTDASTPLIEYFDGETYRKQSNYTSSWVSTATLSNGEACQVGGCLVRPDRFFLTDPNTSSIQPNLTSYKPDKNGANPDYSSLTGNASYYRLFYNSLSGGTTPLASFIMTFSGTFVSDVHSDLINQYLKVTVRKIGAANPSHNYGIASPGLYLHGGIYSFNTFDDGNTDHQIRTSSSGSSVYGTFGGFDATNGMYCEVQICHQNIRIDTITVTFV